MLTMETLLLHGDFNSLLVEINGSIIEKVIFSLCHINAVYGKYSMSQITVLKLSCSYYYTLKKIAKY